MDRNLIGCWRVKTIDMIADKTVTLIGGLPGEVVEFTADGQYIVDLASRRPSASQYSASREKRLGTLDVWIPDLESLMRRCVYDMDEDLLTICIAGDNGERPSEVRRDDNLLWCLVTLERTERPKGGKDRRK